MENAPQLALALEDQPPPWSFGEFAVIAGWIFFLWSTLRWLWTLGHWLCPKDVSAEASKGIRGGGQSRTGSTGKGQGRKGRGTQGCITFRRSSRPTVGDENPGEAPVLKSFDRVSRSQSCSGPLVGSNGTKGSPRGAGPSRYAPPWWSGTGYNAATWLSPPIATTRAMGALGYNAGDPLKCMTNLIHGQGTRRQVFRSEEVEHDRTPSGPLETEQAQRTGYRSVAPLKRSWTSCRARKS